MERQSQPTLDHLKEVAWAVFMIDLILLLVALLFVRHFGPGVTVVVFGSLVALVSLLIGGMAILNVLAVLLYERWIRTFQRR